MPAAALTFRDLFRQATGSMPFAYQRQLANAASLPSFVVIPTGLGKTAAAVLGWLWRRRFARDPIRAATPRRLAYCLPARGLVDQTESFVRQWLRQLDLSAEVTVHVLTGGEDGADWDIRPDADAILIGTQDMLLSRVLNHGYGVSCYRWPVHFGLLNNDCLWIVDDVLLMGVGLTTTLQLDAFRHGLGTIGPAQTVWMSATLDPASLRTVDFHPTASIIDTLRLGAADLADEVVARRFIAAKPLRRCPAEVGQTDRLAGAVLAAHRPSTRTLVVVNTRRRAADLYRALTRRKPDAEIILIHCHFRPADRRAVVERLLSPPGPSGVVAISTPAVEAGVDVSVTTLFTEVAPWPSLVQRFGRCNRCGDDANAAVHWIDLPAGSAGRTLAAPYNADDLATARAVLTTCTDVGPAALPEPPMPIRHGQVVRHKDLVELFDTTPGLSGRDVDVSRFVCDAANHDVQVFWRAVPDDGPGPDDPRPTRDELCAVPVADLRKLLRDKRLVAWVWDALKGVWMRLRANAAIAPGIVVMLRDTDGCYRSETGWDPRGHKPVPAVGDESQAAPPDYDGDWLAEREWMTLAEHTNRVVEAAAGLGDALGLGAAYRDALLAGARWHDAGKAHPVFQQSVRGGNAEHAPPGLLAKTALRHIRHARRGFRHEFVSGLLAIRHGQSDLAAYLAASHHGKVGLAIRSVPIEGRPPDPAQRFARGVWDGDAVPEADLGGGVVAPASVIDLSRMDRGDGSHGPSWLARMRALRDRPDLGPFRLAYLEALLEAADERASGAGPARD